MWYSLKGNKISDVVYEFEKMGLEQVSEYVYCTGNGKYFFEIRDTRGGKGVFVRTKVNLNGDFNGPPKLSGTRGVFALPIVLAKIRQIIQTEIDPDIRRYHTAVGAGTITNAYSMYVSAPTATNIINFNL